MMPTTIHHHRLPLWLALLAAWVLTPLDLHGAQAYEAVETLERIEHFLRTADIVDANRIGKGVTDSWRLTLTDGTWTHDAAFQSVDQRKDIARIGGRTELKFADSYHFNIAAYRLARLLGFDDLVPVSVKRRWNGTMGALTWWIDAASDEASRIEQRVRPPDLSAWVSQHYRMEIFTELVHDTDRNQGNILYEADWHLWMIDFTRAFRQWKELRAPERLVRYDAPLVELLQRLTSNLLRETMGTHLTSAEISGVLARRDLIVARLLAGARP